MDQTFFLPSVGIPVRWHVRTYITKYGQMEINILYKNTHSRRPIPSLAERCNKLASKYSDSDSQWIFSDSPTTHTHTHTWVNYFLLSAAAAPVSTAVSQCVCCMISKQVEGTNIDYCYYNPVSQAMSSNQGEEAQPIM